MANTAFLRKCIRSGLVFLLHRQPCSAQRRLCINSHMDKPVHHHHHHHHRHGLARLQQPTPLAFPICSFNSLSSHASKDRASQGLPLVPDEAAAPGRPACFPLLSPSSSCTLGATEPDVDLHGGYDNEIVDLQLGDNVCDHNNLQQAMEDDCCKPTAARTHSSLKLECNRPPSLKSLIGRGSLLGEDRHSRSSSSLMSQHRHHEGSGNLHGAAGAGGRGEYTRSMSSSSLLLTKKTSGGGLSLHGGLAEGGGSSCGKGKRAPKGHVAVYVDGGLERHVVPIPYLSHPCFEELLRRAESEYGYAQKGGLLLPCSRAELDDTLNCIRSPNHHHHIQKHHTKSSQHS